MQNLIRIGIVVVLFWVIHNLVYLTPEQKKMNRWLESKSVGNEFSDDFEGVKSVSEMFSEDSKKWHELLQQNNTRALKRSVLFCMVSPHKCIETNNPENSVSFERILTHHGKGAVKFHVDPFVAQFFGNSRVALRRQLLNYKEGDEVFFSGWFYFRTDESRKEKEVDNDLNGITFLALRTKGDSLKMFGEPGQRLFLTDRNYLISDMKNWLPKPHVFSQDIMDRVPLSKNEWVRIKVYMKLSSVRENGFLEVWQNDQKIISEKGQTLPNASAVYSVLEVGIIDNLNEKYDQTLYVDDIRISSKTDDKFTR